MSKPSSFCVFINPVKSMFLYLGNNYDRMNGVIDDS